MPPRPIWPITSYLPIFSANGSGSLLIRHVRRDEAPLEIAPSVSPRTLRAQTLGRCANRRGRAALGVFSVRAGASRSEPDRDAVENVVPGELGVRRGRPVAVRETVVPKLHEPVAAEELGVTREPPRQSRAPAEPDRHRAVVPGAGLRRARRILPAGEEDRRPERQIRGERAEDGRAGGSGPPQLEVERDGGAEQVRVDELVRRVAERRIFRPDQRPGAERRDAESRAVDPEREGLQAVEGALDLRSLSAA